MRIRRHRRIDGDRWERLLSHPTAPSRTRRDPLNAVLAAAAGPVRDRELRGEAEAVAAFRAARRRPAPAAPRNRHQMSRGVVVWLTVGAATAVTGVALAAGGYRDPQPAPTEVGVLGPTRPGTSSRPVAAPASPNVRVEAGPTSAASTPSAASSPALLLKLCDGYLDNRHGQRPRAVEPDLPGALIDAAGGREQVDEFCQRLVRPAGTVQPQRSPDGPVPGTPTGLEPTGVVGPDSMIQ